MKKIFNIIIGSLLIAVAFNVFFLSYEIVPNGIFGLATLLNYINGYDPALFVLIVNFSLIIIALLTLGPKKSKDYVWAGLLVPIFMFITNFFINYIYFDNLEKIMVVLAGGFLTGLGYSLIYKVGHRVGGIDIIQDIFNIITDYKNKYISFAIEVVILMLTLIIINLESMLYSLIVIYIIRYIGSKSKIGVSSTKTFFIITNKEEKVKKYILEELNHDLTEFNTKGGYSHNKSKILMVSINNNKYYELKQGILLIDSDAFISITDGYEVINDFNSIKQKINK
ncbi:MAG: YitT family protein [Bacilli bacterium]|nr:YitT family protein [Bacilli bacterium]